MEAENARFASYFETQNQLWSHPLDWQTAAPRELAKFGYYFAPLEGKQDRTLCYVCQNSFCDWTENSDPVSRHMNEAPDCPLSLLYKNKSKSRLSKAVEQSLVEARKATFKNWPLESPGFDQLAQCGFMFNCQEQGDDTGLCVECDLALSGWEPEDDPFYEHAKRAPHCHFIVRNKKAHLKQQEDMKKQQKKKKVKRKAADKLDSEGSLASKKGKKKVAKAQTEPRSDISELSMMSTASIIDTLRKSRNNAFKGDNGVDLSTILPNDVTQFGQAQANQSIEVDFLGNLDQDLLGDLGNDHGTGNQVVVENYEELLPLAKNEAEDSASVKQESIYEQESKPKTRRAGKKAVVEVPSSQEEKPKRKRAAPKTKVKDDVPKRRGRKAAVETETSQVAVDNQEVDTSLSRPEPDPAVDQTNAGDAVAEDQVPRNDDIPTVVEAPVILYDVQQHVDEIHDTPKAFVPQSTSGGIAQLILEHIEDVPDQTIYHEEQTVIHDDTTMVVDATVKKQKKKAKVKEVMSKLKENMVVNSNLFVPRASTMPILLEEIGPETDQDLPQITIQVGSSVSKVDRHCLIIDENLDETVEQFLRRMHNELLNEQSMLNRLKMTEFSQEYDQAVEKLLTVDVVDNQGNPVDVNTLRKLFL